MGYSYYFNAVTLIGEYKNNISESMHLELLSWILDIVGDVIGVAITVRSSETAVGLSNHRQRLFSTRRTLAKIVPFPDARQIVSHEGLFVNL